MKDETMIKLGRLGAGVLLAGIYGFTGANGLFILMAAFLLGVPMDQYVAKRLEKD